MNLINDINLDRELKNASEKVKTYFKEFSLTPNEDSLLSDGITTLIDWVIKIWYKKFEKKVGFTAVNIEKGVVPGKDGALTWIGKLEAKSPG